MFLSIYKNAMKNLQGKGLRKYPLMKQLKKYIKQKAKSDFAVIDGNKMYLGKDDLSLSVNGIYEPLATNWLKKNIKKGDTVVDVGANIGYYTLLLAKLVGENGRVFAFEPEPTNYQILKKNVMVNNYKNVYLENFAVTDYKGKTKLFISEKQMGMHRIYPSKYCSNVFVNVETISLDEYFNSEIKNDISFIKIDVEGSEFGVLKGMKSILQNKGLKILMEFVPNCICEAGNDPQQVLNFLNDFEIKKTIQAENKIVPFDGTPLNGTNLICERSIV